MHVPLRNTQGEVVGEVELREDIFAVPLTPATTSVMHQALQRQLANARLGTRNTKTRSDVSGGGRKVWRQKGTGRARQGSIRAPHWYHGGVVFGPHPRSFAQKMPRKMRRLALRAALSAKAQEQQIIVLDELELNAPKTRDMLHVLNALEVDSSVLILMPQKNEMVELSARNISHVKTLLAHYLNVRDILGFDYLLLPRSSLDVIETILGQ